jgi:AraC-like DNA-binding protein
MKTEEDTGFRSEIEKSVSSVEKMHILQHIALQKRTLMEEEVLPLKDFLTPAIRRIGGTEESVRMLAAICSIDSTDYEEIYRTADYIHEWIDGLCLENRVSILLWDRNNLMAVSLLPNDSLQTRNEKINSYRANWIKLNLQLRKMQLCSVTAAISRTGRIKEIPVLFDECREQLKHRLYMGKDSFIESGMARMAEPVISQPINRANLNRLVARGDIESICRFINGRFMELIIGECTSEDQVRGLCQWLRENLVLTLFENEVTAPDEIEEKQLLEDDMPQFLTIEEYRDWIREIYEDTVHTEIYHNGKTCSPSIYRAAVFIDNNYTQDLTLEIMAKKIGRSRNYFCHQFKKEMGVSFIDYLNMVRVEHAKEMLENSDTLEYKIAASVGYREGKYFSVVFKKVVGVSPREFRMKRRLSA